MPSAPTSNSQPKTSATGKPSTAAHTSAEIAASGMPKPGNNTSATCSVTQAPTRYSAAVRNTLRRRASRNRRTMPSPSRFNSLLPGSRAAERPRLSETIAQLT